MNKYLSLINPVSLRTALSGPGAFLAFGFGSGLSPWAPGTCGTLAAIPFALALNMLPTTVHAALVLAAFILGIFVCGKTSRVLGEQDPGGIVWDEMVGFWVCMLAVPVTPLGMLAAFISFRFFDIFKPWPIRMLESRIKGGAGIMLDDVGAAVYSVILLLLVRYLLSVSGINF